MKRGEIYWCQLYGNGHLENKVRPVIIWAHSTNAPTATVIPLTSALKRNDIKTHVKLNTRLKKRSMALVEQITTINTYQLLNYECKARECDIRRIAEAIAVHLGVR